MLLYFVGIICVVGSVVQCNIIDTLEPHILRPRSYRVPITAESELNELKHTFLSLLAELSVSHENHPKFQNLEIVSASRQTVGGTNTRAEVSIEENEVLTKCVFTFYERLWENYKKFEVTCGETEPRSYILEIGPVKNTRKITGGFTDVSPDKLDEVTALLTDSLVEVNNKHKTEIRVVRVFSARKQVIAGTKTIVMAELASPEWTQNCTAEIWEKPWENHFRETNLKCNENGFTEISGGIKIEIALDSRGV